MTPFGNESFKIGSLTLESSGDRLSLYGSLDLTRSREGLADARQLAGVLNTLVAALEREGSRLPERPDPPVTGTMDNPFA